MRRRTEDATGSNKGRNRGQVRFVVIVEDEVFAELKAAAIANERSIGGEVRFRIKNPTEVSHG